MKRVRDVGREGVLAWLFALLAVAGLAFLLFGSNDGPDGADDGPKAVAAVTGDVVLRDKIVSHGGYNTFAGAWLRPSDDAVFTAFANVTGSAAPPCRRTDEPEGCDDRGFRGASHHYVVLDSTDDGRTFKRALPDEKVQSAAPHAYSGQAVIALKDHDNGVRRDTLLRRVNGEDIGIYREFRGSVPETAFLQRLAPGAKRWTGRQVLLDEARYTYNFTRLLRLRDDTLLAIGAFWEIPAGRRVRDKISAPPQWLLMASTDEGATWHNAMEVPAPSAASAPAGEWDVAELNSGDLLAMMRTRQGRGFVRKQVVLQRTDDTIATNTGTQSAGGWRMGAPELTPAGLPQIATPQHPELLRLEYGPAAGGILHFADEAIHYTADGGKSWRRVSFPGGWTPHYYPNSVQAPGGNIYVFSHHNSDEHYVTNAPKPIYSDVVRVVADRDVEP